MKETEEGRPFHEVIVNEIEEGLWDNLKFIGKLLIKTKIPKDQIPKIINAWKQRLKEHIISMDYDKVVPYLQKRLKEEEK